MAGKTLTTTQYNTNHQNKQTYTVNSPKTKKAAEEVNVIPTRERAEEEKNRA